MKRPALWTATATVLALLALAGLWSSAISGSEIDKDGAETLRMALDLAHHGEISMDPAPPFSPSMYREPLPVLTTALAVRLVDAFLGRADDEQYRSGPRARWVKQQNVLWMALVLVATVWATRLLSSSAGLGLGLVAASLVGFKLIPIVSVGLAPFDLDSLYTDVAAAAMLMLGSAALAHAWRTRRTSHYAAAGLCFGALALIKAAALYVFVGLACALVVLGVVRRGALRAVHWAALAAAFAMVVLPWMLRDYAELGRFQLSERGGLVLLVRAVQDGMTPKEYAGTFYAWAPAHLQPMLGAVLGFSPADLRKGGRLERLNRSRDSGFYEEDLAAEVAAAPERAVTYYRAARARREQLRHEQARAGAASAAPIDDILEREAMARIVGNPLKHLAMSLPYLWRGAFFAFPMVAVVLAYALRRKRYDVVVFVLPTLGWIGFHALFTHFIPRYGVPALPIAVVCFVLAARAALPNAAAIFTAGLAALRRSAASRKGRPGYPTSRC